jgi:hypothetical protein
MYTLHILEWHEFSSNTRIVLELLNYNSYKNFLWISMFFFKIDYGLFALALFTKELRTIARTVRMHKLATSTD